MINEIIKLSTKLINYSHSPRLDAELLLANVCNVNREKLYTQKYNCLL